MSQFHSIQGRSRQRGVVLIFCLIVLVILLAGGVAVVRSMNSSLFSAGNLAFKRDLLNQGHLATTRAVSLFAAGGALASNDGTSRADLNYSAVQLNANAQGIPVALLGNDATFASIGAIANDIVGEGQVIVRYVIERLCSSAGVATSTTCVQSQSAPPGGSAKVPPPPPPPTATVYRLTARVTGPRDTQLFTQTTFSKPD